MPSMNLLDLSRPTSLLAIGLMLVILMMVLPVPAWVMDIGLTASFAFAILRTWQSLQSPARPRRCRNGLRK